MGYGASYGCKSAFRGPTQNFAPEKCRLTRYFALSISHLLWDRVPTNFELGQKLIQILKAVFINFRALKVVKWSTVLHMAVNWLSVDPHKILLQKSADKHDILLSA